MNFSNDSFVDVLPVFDDILTKFLLIMILYVVGSILSLVIGYYLETRKLRLLMSAKPELIALEFFRVMREYVREYGPIKSSNKPGYLVVKKWLRNPGYRLRLLKIAFLVLVLVLVIYILMILYS